MTLIKSLLLGSAAGVVAVSAAQAADLPTKKGPIAAEYVRVCSITVNGAPIVGFVLPGSDTCFKVSGYITGQIEGGNLKTARTYGIGNNFQGVNANTFNRDSFGYSTRLNLGLDTVSNTAYGPLVGHAEIQIDHGSGFDNVGGGATQSYVNRAYVTWAGLTAGRANSFFSFTGGGLAWANFFSPDRNGSNQPDLLAYTASFGGGFTATLAIENPTGTGRDPANGGVDSGYLGSANQGGLRIPDIVGSLDVRQAWGNAHLAGVAHNVRASNANSSIDKWGFAIDAGVQFNIPSLPGSIVGVTGAWAQNAVAYSGITDGMWGENGAVNGNGQAMAIGDAYWYGGNNWASPTAWSVTAYGQVQASATVTLGLEGSFGAVRWSNTTAATGLYNSKSFIVGGVAHYQPVKNLDFEFELLYQSTTSTRPATIAAGNAWDGSANGFAARFEVTRNF